VSAQCRKNTNMQWQHHIAWHGTLCIAGIAVVVARVAVARAGVAVIVVAFLHGKKSNLQQHWL